MTADCAIPDIRLRAEWVQKAGYRYDVVLGDGILSVPAPSGYEDV